MGELKRILDGKGADGWPLDGIPGWVLSYLAPLNAKARGERLTELHAALLDAARTEGRGEGEPVASDKALFDALWELVAAMANEGIPQTPKTKAAFKVAHQVALDRLRKDWSSPIREPEISRPDRELAAREAFRVLHPHENWNDLDERYDARGGYHPMQIKAFEVADAILNLAPVGGRGEETGWLIERQDLAPYPLYMRHTRRGHSWTPDPNEAALFATKDEASAECCGGDESGPLKVTEHMWLPLPRKSKGG